MAAASDLPTFSEAFNAASIGQFDGLGLPDFPLPATFWIIRPQLLIVLHFILDVLEELVGIGLHIRDDNLILLPPFQRILEHIGQGNDRTLGRTSRGYPATLLGPCLLDGLQLLG